MNRSPDNSNTLNQNHLYMLYLSFIPLLIKGVAYAWIGSPYIMVLGVTTVIILLSIIHFKTAQVSKVIKIWSILLIGYGTMRLFLGSMNLFMDAIESTIVYQLTFWYYLKSLLYIILGLFLGFRK